MCDGFEGEVTFFFLGHFVGGFLDQFHVDIGPVICDVVALEHHQIGILYVQLYWGYVLHY